jgi:WD40 repeat protein
MYTLERVGNSLTAVSSSSFGASPTQSTTYFAVNNDGTILALGTSDLTTVNIFDVSNHRTFIPHENVRSIAFHPLFPVLATGNERGTVKLWRMLLTDIPEEQLITRDDTSVTIDVKFCINSVAFHPTKKLLATGSDDKTTRVWSFDDKYEELICQATLKHGDDDI